MLPVPSDRTICGSCYRKISFLPGDYFHVSYPHPEGIIDLKVICLCDYDGVMKEALKRFKFYHRSGYYRAFGVLLGEKIKKMTKCRIFDIITYVPLHRSRERERGYNQSYLLAKALRRELHMPPCSAVLSRVRETRCQSLLNKSERVSNIRDAFAVKGIHKIAGKSVLLVDDILTTGSTLGECSRMLLSAGAKEVICAVIASGRKV